MAGKREAKEKNPPGDPPGGCTPQGAGSGRGERPREEPVCASEYLAWRVRKSGFRLAGVARRGRPGRRIRGRGQGLLAFALAVRRRGRWKASCAAVVGFSRGYASASFRRAPCLPCSVPPAAGAWGKAAGCVPGQGCILGRMRHGENGKACARGAGGRVVARGVFAKWLKMVDFSAARRRLGERRRPFWRRAENAAGAGRCLRVEQAGAEGEQERNTCPVPPGS